MPLIIFQLLWLIIFWENRWLRDFLKLQIFKVFASIKNSQFLIDSFKMKPLGGSTLVLGVDIASLGRYENRAKTGLEPV